MKADLGRIKAVIRSYGHPDHFLGLVEILKLIGEERDKGVTLYLHPDAFLERRTNIPAIGHPVIMPAFDEGILIEAGVVPIKSKKALMIANSLIHTTGKVERTTAFEKGLSGAEAKIDGNWTIDPFRDDQGLIIKLKNKRLVIISSCAHAGIINTVEYAKKITRTNKVHAIVGGFHFPGQFLDQKFSLQLTK